MLHTETYRLPFASAWSCYTVPKIIGISAWQPSLTLLERKQQYSILYILVPYMCIYRHTVASAPNVTGSGFMQRFRLFLGQCALCMVGFPFEPVARFSLAFICLVDLMEWWWYQRRSSAAVYSQLYIYSNLHHHTKWFSFSKCISWIASIY